MTETWFFTLLAVALVSCIALIGVVTLALNSEKLRRGLLYLVSFAAGALLGDAFLHLLPEAVEEVGDVERVSMMVLAGIVIFFILEKVLFWHHCHLPTHEQHKHPVGMMNLISDGVHNFLDGVIIAGSFLVDVPLGIATTVAVVLHEIPQEIGDFGILLHSGYSKRKALFFNFLTACLAIFGAVLTLIIGEHVQGIVKYVLPLTLGGFIYIAAADLIPELHREQHTGRSFAQFVAFMLGIGIMALMLLLE